MFKNSRRFFRNRRMETIRTQLGYQALEDRRLLSATEPLGSPPDNDDSAAPAAQFSSNRTRRIEGTVTGASGATHPVAIERFDSPNAVIDETLETWLVVHGRNSSPTSATIDPLVRAAANQSSYQILTLDWSSAATTSLSLGELNIVPVATWAATALSNYGFVGQAINLVGHSFGTYISFEAAGRINGGINALVALDPVADVPGNAYNPDATVNFAEHTNLSTVLHSRDGFLGGISGNHVTSATADEAIVVINSGHSEVVDVFTNMLNESGSCQLDSHFSLPRITNRLPAPWLPNQFDDNARFTPTGQFEAVITADDATGEIGQSIWYLPDAVDLGIVDFVSMNNADISCESWYQVRTSQSGYLTAQLSFSHSDGDVNLEMYNSQLERVAISAGTLDLERVEITSASAGESYFLRITGSNADIDMRVANLVARTGSLLSVHGSSNLDNVTHDAQYHSINVNGVVYEYAANEISQILIDGGSGTDVVNLNGTDGSESAVLRAGEVTLVGDGFTATATNFEETNVRGLGGLDTAELYDTPGDDILRGFYNRMVLQGGGFVNRASGFETSNVFASIGNDVARVLDASGDDQYRAYPDRVMMVGQGYQNQAWNFDQAFGFSSSGNDMAYLYDSTGDDRFRSYPDRVVMTGDGYFIYASGFSRNFGYSTVGNDTALMFDSTGNDLFRTYPDRVVMTGDDYFNWAGGFARNFGYATSGFDESRMFDSDGNDLLRTYANRVVMTGAGFFNWAGDFERNTSYASTGYDSARLFDSTGDDLVVAEAWGAYMVHEAGHYFQARSFDLIDAWSENGGLDAAEDRHTGYLFRLRGDGWD